jgi:hypothetical protein
MFYESLELGSVDGAGKTASQRPRPGLLETRRSFSIRGYLCFSSEKYLEVDREDLRTGVRSRTDFRGSERKPGETV